MWTASYSKHVPGLTAAQVWKVWSDVDQWHTWQDDIDSARMLGEFKAGGKFHFKPKGGPNLTLELTEVREGETFTDLTRFPLARMYDSHDLVEDADGVEIRLRMRLEGPLSFVWRKLVAEDVARGFEEQTTRLIDKVRHG